MGVATYGKRLGKAEMEYYGEVHRDIEVFVSTGTIYKESVTTISGKLDPQLTILFLYTHI